MALTVGLFLVLEALLCLVIQQQCSNDRDGEAAAKMVNGAARITNPTPAAVRLGLQQLHSYIVLLLGEGSL